MTKKILVCIEEEDVREALKLILQDYYNLILTDGLEYGLTCLTDTKDIALMLLTYNLTADEDKDMLKKFKRKYPGLKILLISNYKSGLTSKQLTQLGAIGQLSKPFRADAIRPIIDQAIYS